MGFTANVSFHEQVRRTLSATNGNSSSRNDMGDDMPGLVVETSPLLGQERRRNALYHVLLDRKHTPGMESPRPVVKWSACGWHNAKITILSSMSCLPLLTAATYD